MRKRIPAVALLSLTLSAGAAADTITDLRGILKRFPAAQPLHSTYEVTRSRHAKGKFLTEDFSGSASIDVVAENGAVRIGVPKPLLERAESETTAKAADPARAAGTDAVLQEVLPQAVDSLIDAAGRLSDLLLRASIIEQRNEPFAGKPARAIVAKLQLSPSGPGAEVGAVKVSDDRLTVWVGPDGVPVGAQRVRTGKVGIFLVHADTVRRETWMFAVRGDHLCVSRVEDHSTVSGIGQDGEATTVWTMKAASS